MPKHDADQLPEMRRKDIFRALVQAQDGGMSIEESHRYVAERFGVTEGQVRQVELEGVEIDWPRL
jgi:hypothetical protein